MMYDENHRKYFTYHGHKLTCHAQGVVYLLNSVVLVALQWKNSYLLATKQPNFTECSRPHRTFCTSFAYTKKDNTKCTQWNGREFNT